LRISIVTNKTDFYENAVSMHSAASLGQEGAPRLLRPGPSQVAVSDRAGTLRSVYGVLRESLMAYRSRPIVRGDASWAG
jgi:hypothetical protein